MQKKKLYIDTDISLGTPGAEIDDGAALMMLLNHPEMDIIGIGSVFGNAPVAEAYQNLDRLMHYCDRSDIPIGLGTDQPLEGNMDWFASWRNSYGKTVAWQPRPSQIASTELLIDCVKKNPGQISILAIGPLTNIAKAIQQVPEIMPDVREIFAMGGSFSLDSVQPEFNVRCDPLAAFGVMHAGWPITLFGLQLTRQVKFERDCFKNLPNKPPAIKLLKDQAAGWIDRVVSMGWEQGGCSLHDAVAAACFLDRTLFKSQPMEVSVSLDKDEKFGATTVKNPQKSGSSIQVAYEIDVQRCHDMIWSLCCDK